MLWTRRDCSTTLRVQIVSLIWLTLLIALSPAASPPNEPVIYFQLARWENRTFSPRLYYLMLLNGQKPGKQSQVEHEGYQIAVDYPPSVNKIEDIPFISVRNGFSKPASNDADGKGAATGSSKGGEILLGATQGSLGDFPLYEGESEPTITFDGGKKEEAIIQFEPAEGAQAAVGYRRRHGNHGGKQNNNTDTINRSTFGDNDGLDIQKHNRICRSRNRGSYGNSKRIRSYESGTIEGGLNTMDFAFKIIHKTKQHDGNFVFSPFSVINILTLLMLGSRGTSHQELAKLLGVSDKPPRNDTTKTTDIKFHTGFSDASYALLQCPSEVILESANKLFTHISYPVSPDFSSFAKSFYDADIESFDFQKSTDFPDIANEWIKENTHGQIQNIVDHSPSPVTTLVMLNALYFKGEWETPFESRLTRSGHFHLNENVSVPVHMMTNVMTIPHIETECYTMIRLPYHGNDTSMFVILPVEKGIAYLQRVEKELTAKIIQENINHLSGTYLPPRLVTVKMPKMRVESLGHMRTVLEDIGLKTVFNPRSANFSNISPEPGLYVDSVLHKAVVDIDEKGSEASAVSVATVDRIIERNPIMFNANRPFIFFIYNHFAELTLFWGRVTDPQSLQN